MSIIYIVLMFFACMILYKSGIKFFILWLGICAVVFYFLNAAAGVWGLIIYGYMWSHDGYTEEDFKSRKNRESITEIPTPKDKIYADGTKRIENLSKTGYYYSNGMESRSGMFDEEYRSNGEVLYDNPLLPGQRDIYNEKNEYVGYEYEDLAGITHRVEKNQLSITLINKKFLYSCESRRTKLTSMGGMAERSIGYIAKQNLDTLDKGAETYDYVWNIIKYIYRKEYVPSVD